MVEKQTDGGAGAVAERRQGAIFPLAISAETVVEAPLHTVWQVLTDFPRYGEWNPFTPSVETDFRLGSPVAMQVRLVPGRKLRRQVEYLNVLEPGRRFAYGYDLGCRWLLRANRFQELEDLGGGRTRYYTTDRFSGLMVPLISRLYGAHIRRGFEDTAAALKARAEALAR